VKRSAAPRSAGDRSTEIERAAYRERLDVFLGSREAGHALTLDALRAGITLKAVVSAAADLAEYADEALSIVREEYHPRVDCKEGCWYCCCKPNVLTSVPELARILEHVRTTFSPDAIASLKARARRYAEQMEGRRVEDPLNESVPCPLLVEGRCSAYEVRPLICRGYNSTNVDACRKAHDNADVLVPTFAILKDVTDGATVGAAQRLKAAGFNDSMVDLGTALNIALAGGDGFAEAIVQGSADLTAAENPSWAAELWGAVRKTAQSVGRKIEVHV